MSQVNRVLVVGGGITGGVLSLALRQKDVEVVLVDLRESLGELVVDADRLEGLERIALQGDAVAHAADGRT